MIKNKITLCLVVVIIFSLAGCSSRKSFFKKFKKEMGQGKVTVYPQQEVEKQIVEPLGKLIPGEKLYFKISWLGINVGQASLEVKDAGIVEEKDAALVELCAWTTGLFKFVYDVEGKIQSYVNFKDFKPIKYNSYTRINKKIIKKNMNFDFKKNKVYAKDKKGEYVIDVPDDVLDPLGVFYYFRKNPVKMNEPINLIVSAGKKNFPVIVFAVRQRMIHVPAGRFWAFQVEPTKESERQFDDSLNAEGSMRIWFSADAKRFPLQIALKVPVGSAVATLMRIEYAETELTQD